MIRALALSAVHGALLERAARGARPGEYTAALLGRVAGDAALVTDVVRLRNCDTRPGRFAVPDSELRRAELLARERGGEVVALAHSHPTSPPVPSDRDALAIARARHPWLIVGFGDGDRLELAAFCQGSGGALPVQVGR
jgi:proteasome lid subunit RPN8/RPN11